MNDIFDATQKVLKKTSVNMPRFQQIVARLLGRGIIVYGDSQAESELYNDASRVESLLIDYFSVFGATLFHDHHFSYFRLYPPGTDIQGQNSETEPSENSLRQNLNQHETAAVLVLRFLYDQALQEGSLDDAAEAQVSLEALHTAMQTRLNRTMPPTSGERKNVFRKLKRLKLIKFSSEDDLDQPETWLTIRPMITGFLNPASVKILSKPNEKNHVN